MDLAAIATIVIAPILSNQNVSFSFVQNILVRLLLIIAILIAIRKGPLTGLLTMLAVFTIITERNHQILMNLPGLPSSRVPSEGPGVPIKARPLTPRKQNPHTESIGISVSENNDEIFYESAEDIHDNNPELEKGPSNDEAVDFYESKGLV